MDKERKTKQVKEIPCVIRLTEPFCTIMATATHSVQRILGLVLVYSHTHKSLQ